ncbi:hypothetical protein V6N11_063278 [Hibiscus sabdariffa]|uniref:Uncharacterized protein n=1 Tax=Hibiscus sabdariffa TaxID=183260 RepID=A0ABR2NH61_9ROSI
MLQQQIFVWLLLLLLALLFFCKSIFLRIESRVSHGRKVDFTALTTLVAAAVVVRREGIAGGLALWWDNDTKISIIRANKNVIDCSISCCKGNEWFCSFVYGPSYREKKEKFWEGMKSLRRDREAPWCVMGDSNIVIRKEEKLGGNIYDLGQANWILNFIGECDLLEMNLKCGPFSWSNQRTDNESILEGIDRVLFNSSWFDLFNRAEGFLETAIGSDYNPIICNLFGYYRKRMRDFKFESKWLLEDDCNQVITNSWKHPSIRITEENICSKLSRTSNKLKKWCREKFGKHKRKLDELQKQISDIQKGQLMSEYADLVNKLKEELDKE